MPILVSFPYKICSKVMSACRKPLKSVKKVLQSFIGLVPAERPSIFAATTTSTVDHQVSGFGRRGGVPGVVVVSSPIVVIIFVKGWLTNPETTKYFCIYNIVIVRMLQIFLLDLAFSCLLLYPE